LVTTKSGANKKATLSYNFSYGFKTAAKLPELASAGEYAQYISDYQDYEGLSRLYSDRDIELYKSGEDPWEHPNTNWLDDLVKDWTNETHHNVSINGGSDKMRYYASFGYKSSDAFYEQSDAKYKQYNLRVKLDIPITDWLETSVQYGGFMTNRNYPTVDTYYLTGWSTLIPPTQPSFWPTGEPGPDFESGINPVVNTSFEAGYDKRESYKNEVTFRASIKPPMIEGLSIDGFFNYDVNNSNKKLFKKPWTLYYMKEETAVRDANGFITSVELEPRLRGLDSPELTEENSRTRKKMFNLSFNYGRTFGDHTFSIFGAYEQHDEDYFIFDAYRKYFISDLVQALSAGGDAEKSNSGSLSIYARKSWIGRLNYSYKDRYLMEFIFRRDGSLKFPPNSRWGNFPALMLAWRASEEKFWKENLSFIDYFKLRATYGKMGMDPGDAFQYINKYALDAGMTFGTDKSIVTKIYQSVIANANITWEKQATYNVGFDSQFLNQMFHLNAEFFYNRRSDILVKRDASVPAYTGLALPDENIGIVDNKGVEIDAGFHKTFGDVRFDLSGNISWARNKVVEMDEPEVAVPWQRETGHPYGTKLVYNAIGIFKTQAEVDAYPHWTGAKPGDVIFEDYNEDGVIDANDRILMDKTDAPELFYGIKLDLAYKNWSLSLLAQGQGSYYVNSISGNRGVGQNVYKWMANGYWTPENSDSNQARPFHRADQYWSYLSNDNSYWFENMAYLRLKNVTLNYMLPQTLTKKVGVSRADLFFSGYNLFMLYSAQNKFDAEVADPESYPTMKTYSIGVKVTF
jgi:TonB-linked SusC/RagA family outer membrane protein